MKFRYKIFVLISAIMLLASLAVFNNNAYGIGLGTVIGGRISSTTFCTCNFLTKVTVTGPAGGTFMKIPFVTRVYDYKKVSEGKNTLGTALPGYVPCMQYALVGCVTDGGGPPITKIGTSN